MKYLVPAILLSCSVSMASINKNGAKPATSRKEFCAKAKDPDYFKSLFYARENQISFLNKGGLMNGGVCWWHSMLTRAAQYLTVYRPDLPKASSDQAYKIVQWLSANKGVVEIPGYRNFYEFSADHSNTILSALEGWQIVDGGFAFGWVRGVSGNHKVDADEFAKMMNETYKIVKSEKKVAYQKLQIEGIESHAWLVVDMEKTGNGYILDVVDSNYRGVSQVHYVKGMTQLREYESVPYTSRNAFDYRSFTWAIDQYCKRNLTAEDLDSQLSGDSLYR